MSLPSISMGFEVLSFLWGCATGNAQNNPNNTNSTDTGNTVVDTGDTGTQPFNFAPFDADQDGFLAETFFEDHADYQQLLKGTQYEGQSDTNCDCDDTNASVHPSVADNTNDGVDNNCDGTADEGYVAPDVCDGVTGIEFDTTPTQVLAPGKVVPLVQVGDVTGDGVGDMVYSLAKGKSTGRGEVYVVDGAKLYATGNANPVAVMTGSKDGYTLGAVFFLADVDKDGTLDIVASDGAMNAKFNTTGLKNDSGGVFIFKGGSTLVGDLSADTDTYAYSIGNPSEYLSLDQNIGDWDGDGYPEMAKYAVNSSSLSVVTGLKNIKPGSNPSSVFSSSLTLTSTYWAGADFSRESMSFVDTDFDGNIDLLSLTDDEHQQVAQIKINSSQIPSGTVDIFNTSHNPSSVSMNYVDVHGLPSSALYEDLDSDGFIDVVVGDPDVDNGQGGYYFNRDQATNDVSTLSTITDNDSTTTKLGTYVAGGVDETCDVGVILAARDRGGVKEWVVQNIPGVEHFAGSASLTNSNQIISDQDGVILADVNGDGTPDLVTQGAGDLGIRAYYGHLK